MNNGFFAMINRLKYINRWALMRNTQNENLSDHSVQVAFIAHALALIGNEKLNKNYNVDRVSTLAMYHDVTEILTGDMPTPIKYKNETLKKAYKDVEKEAAQRLLKMLPDYLVKSYDNILMPSDMFADFSTATFPLVSFTLASCSSDRPVVQSTTGTCLPTQ